MKGITFIILCISLHIAAQISPNINQYNKQGKKHGIWKGYHENTQTKRYEGEFNHGTPVGRFTYYAIEGHVSGKVDFINDSISSAQMFHDRYPDQSVEYSPPPPRVNHRRAFPHPPN